MRSTITRLVLSMATFIALISSSVSVRAADESPELRCLEDGLRSGKRFDIETASRCIVGWVCKEEAQTADLVRLEACISSTANLLSDKESKLNFLGSASNLFNKVQAHLGEPDGFSQDFWAEYGVTPHRAVRCATAMLKYRQCSGFWDTLNAEQEMANACTSVQLAPELFAEAQRRGM